MSPHLAAHSPQPCGLPAAVETRGILYGAAGASPDASKIRPGLMSTTPWGVYAHAALNALNSCSTKPG
eukprot:3261766-Pleurochrysis_carterae.AAC.1